jgi:hypothetical protein
MVAAAWDILAKDVNIAARPSGECDRPTQFARSATLGGSDRRGSDFTRWLVPERIDDPSKLICLSHRAMPVIELQPPASTKGCLAERKAGCFGSPHIGPL